MPITTNACGVLRWLNNAFHVLNAPPIVVLGCDEFGAVDLVSSFVVRSGGRVEVRTQVMCSRAADAAPRRPT